MGKTPEEMKRIMKSQIDGIEPEDYVDFEISFTKHAGEEDFISSVNIHIEKKVLGRIETYDD